MRAGDARALAGGTDLVPQLREGRRRAARIVDLKHIPEMTAIAALPDGGVSIGAAADATAVARHAAIAAGYPAVAQSAQLIGGVQVQNRASLGGNICNAAPSADARAGAHLPRGAGRDRRPQRPARDAGRGDVRGARPHERSSRASCWSRSCCRRPQPRSAGELSALHAAARDGHRHRRSRRLAAARRGRRHRGGAHRAGLGRADADPRAVGRAEARRRAAERARCSRRPAGSLRSDARPISDTRGSADYRRTLVAVLTARALADCCRQLGLEVAARMKTLLTCTVNGEERTRARRHARHAARAAARSARPDRHQGRLRQRQLRHLHGADGRRARQRLPGAGAGGAGPRHHHHRGPFRRRRAAPASSRRWSSMAARNAASARRASCSSAKALLDENPRPTRGARSATPSPATCAAARATARSSRPSRPSPPRQRGR